MRKYGFTLIELLIVVAIIAILAAIAVPNFLEAQTRAKVSRVQADLRTYATGIETYRIDNNKYPSIFAPTSPIMGGSAPGDGINGASVFLPGEAGISARFIWITTPIAYLTTIYRDPFIPANSGKALAPDGRTLLAVYDCYDYVDSRTLSPANNRPTDFRGASICSGGGYHIVSCGPDRRNCFGGSNTGSSADAKQGGCDYDATNGTLSAGDVVRVGGVGTLYGGMKPTYNRVTGEVNL